MAVEDVLIRIIGDSSSAQRALRGTSRDLKLLGGGSLGVQALAQSFTAASTGAVALGNSIKPMVPMVAALPAAFTAVAQAVGVWKLATKDLSEALSGNKAALKRLTPEAKSFVKDMKETQKELRETQRIAQRGLFPGLEDGIDSAKRNLPVVNRLVGDTARAMGQLAREAGGNLGNQWWARDISIVGRRNVRYLQDAGKSIIYVANGLRQIVVASKPVTDFASKGALELSKRFDEWARLNRQSGGFRVMFEESVRAFNRWRPVAMDVVKIIDSISSAGEAMSGSLFGEAAAQIDKLAKAASSLKGQMALQDFFADGGNTLREMARLVRDVGKAFLEIGKGNELANLISMLRTEFLPILVDSIKRMNEILGPALIESLRSIAQIMKSAAGPTADVVEAFARWLGIISDIVQNVPGMSELLGILIAMRLAIRGIAAAGALTGLSRLMATRGATAGAAGGTAAGSAFNRAFMKAIVFVAIGDSLVKAIEDALNAPDLEHALKSGFQGFYKELPIIGDIAHQIRKDGPQELKDAIDIALKASIVIPGPHQLLSIAEWAGLDPLGLKNPVNFTKSVEQGIQRALNEVNFRKAQRIIAGNMKTLLRPETFKLPMIKFGDVFQPLMNYLGQLPREARVRMARFVLEMTAQSERLKLIPKGSTAKLRRLILADFLTMKSGSLKTLRELVGETRVKLEELKNIKFGLDWGRGIAENGRITRREIDRTVRHLSKMPDAFRKQTALAMLGQLAELQEKGKITEKEYERFQDALVAAGILGRKRTVKEARGMADDYHAAIQRGGSKSRASFQFTQKQVVSMAKAMHGKTKIPVEALARLLQAQFSRGGSKARGHMKVTRDQVAKLAQSMHEMTGISIVKLSEMLDKALKKIGAKPVKFAPAKITAGTGVRNSITTGGNLSSGVGTTGGQIDDFSRSKLAAGGYVGRPGESGQDNVAAMLPPGTPILNRHQQPLAAMAMQLMGHRLASGGLVPVMLGRGERIVSPQEAPVLDAGLHRMGIGGLAGLFGAITRPHYLASGGPVPANLIPLYQRAAARYGLGPQGPSILAAINDVETEFGRNLSVSSAGATGWMQFMPGTWASYGVDADGSGSADPSNPKDAIFAAANYLHASGAPSNWQRAIYAYNHADWYVSQVMSLANKFAGAAPGSAVPLGGGLAPVQFDQLPQMLLGGPAGQLKGIGQGVLDTAVKAANMYGNAQAGSMTDGLVPGATAGTTMIQGFPVANWIAVILKQAMAAGVRFTLTDGFRTYAQQAALVGTTTPVATPGTSHHEFTRYPMGAIDLSAIDGSAGRFNQWLLGSKWRNTLIYAGAKDPVHFSHPVGGSYAKGGIVKPHKVIATYFNDKRGYHGDNLYKGPLSYAELGMGTRLGKLKYKTPLDITYKGKTVRAYKMDIGSGARGAQIDLHRRVADALGFTKIGRAAVTIKSPGAKAGPKPTMLSSVQAQLLRRPLTDDAFSAGLSIGQSGGRRLGLDFLSGLFDDIPVGIRHNFNRYTYNRRPKMARGGYTPTIIGHGRGVGGTRMDRVAQLVGTSMYGQLGQEALTQLSGLINSARFVTVRALATQRQRIVRRIMELERGGITPAEQKLITSMRAEMSILAGEMGRRVGGFLRRADLIGQRSETHATRIDQRMRVLGIDPSSSRGLGWQRVMLGQQIGATAQQAALIRKAIARAKAAGDDGTVRELQDRLRGLTDSWHDMIASWVERGRDLVAAANQESADRNQRLVDMAGGRVGTAQGNLEQFDIRRQLGLTRRGETRAGYAFGVAGAMSAELRTIQRAADRAWRRGDMAQFGELLQLGREKQTGIYQSQLDVLLQGRQSRIDTATSATGSARRALEGFDLRSQLGIAPRGQTRGQFTAALIKALGGERDTLLSLGADARRRGDTATYLDYIAQAEDKTNEILQAQLDVQQSTQESLADRNELISQQRDSALAALRVSQAQYAVFAGWLGDVRNLSAGHMGGFATGGLITGMPAFRGVDNLTANVSHGEYIMRKAAVTSIGASNLDYMNRTGNVGGGPTIVKAPDVYITVAGKGTESLIQIVEQRLARPGGLIDRRIGRDARSRSLAPGR